MGLLECSVVCWNDMGLLEQHWIHVLLLRICIVFALFYFCAFAYFCLTLQLEFVLLRQRVNKQH